MSTTPTRTEPDAPPAELVEAVVLATHAPMTEILGILKVVSSLTVDAYEAEYQAAREAMARAAIRTVWEAIGHA